MADAENCGECGHDCLGGTCDAGECQPVQLATGYGRLFMVVATDQHLFVGGDGVAIRRLDKDGGDPVQIAPAGDYAYDYAYTGDAVVWNNDWNSAQWSVRGCAAPGCAGGIQQYETGSSGVFGMAYNDGASTLYYNQGSTIREIVWPGGAEAVFVSGVQTLRSMVSHQDFIYWTDRQAANDVDILKRAPGAGGTTITVASGRPDTGSWMAANATRLFWSEGSDIVSATLPAGIGANEPDAVGSAGDSVREIVADDEFVYWAASADAGAGSIARCPSDGCAGAPTILAQPVDPWGMAQDDTAIYWVTEGGVVGRVAK